MLLLGWNVNGLRAQLKKDFLTWMSEVSPDILCIQETKCHPDQLPEHVLNLPNYHTYWASAEKKGYSGVAVFSKTKPCRVQVGLGVDEFDQEGRTLILEYDEFTLFNIYYPNGGSGNKRVPFKMAFYDAFLNLVTDLKQQGKNLVITGDVNTAHHEIDLARPKENQNNTGFLQEERDWVTDFLNAGFVDTFRHFHPDEPDHYTWWDYKTRARARNIGWRIDYFFVSDNYLSAVENSFIIKEKMGSDHCPIGLTLNTKI